MVDADLIIIDFLDDQVINKLFNDHDMVVACDVLPPRKALTSVVTWDEAINDGYEEPKFISSKVLVPSDLGIHQLEGQKYFIANLVLHSSSNNSSCINY